MFFTLKKTVDVQQRETTTLKTSKNKNTHKTKKHA